MNDSTHPSPNNDLQIRILQLLSSMQQQKPFGASGRQLRDQLRLGSVIELAAPLGSLRKRGFVDATYAERVFLITPRGLEYLGDSGQDGYQPSLVPRRPFPFSGTGELKLPLPNESEF